MSDCGYNLNPVAKKTSESNCNTKCAGDPDDFCGGDGDINIYFNYNDTSN